MRHQNAFRARRLDGGHQARPVGVVGQRKAAVESPPAAISPHLHPAARQRIGIVAEPLEPGARGSRRRRDNEGARELALVLDFRRKRGRRQGDPGLAIERVDRLDRAVTDDRSERWVDMGDEPLRLAERIGEDDAGAPSGDVLAPPRVDGGENVGLRAPAVDRQAEGRIR